MLTLLLIVLALMLAGKIVVFALKAAWGITKIALHLVFLPVIIIGAIVLGLVKIALPIFIIALIVATIASPKSAQMA
jgi:hypothetical protein